MLGLLGAGAIGVLTGRRLQDAQSRLLECVQNRDVVTALVPAGQRFRYYSVTDTQPDVAPATYRLSVIGMVDHPVELTLADLEAMPQAELVRDFQCVTGWRVPRVHWSGVALPDLLDRVRPHSAARAVRFFSYDGTYTESLTLSQADEAQLLASGAYAKELLAAAAEADLAMFEEDERLLCYPSIVRLLPGELALEVDRKRVRGLRPPTVVAALQRAQQAGPRFKPEPFLASLVGAYDLVVASQGKQTGAVVRLLEIYGVLTLLPGQVRDYTKPEFARDLYLLDQTGVTTGPGGRRLRWAASSGTRQAGVLTTVAKSGQQQRYWGIAFEEAAS